MKGTSSLSIAPPRATITGCNIRGGCTRVAALVVWLVTFNGYLTYSWWHSDLVASEQQTIDWLALNPDDKPWSNIAPSAQLVYHECYTGWQCARLKVPLDWNSTQPDQKSVALAILKIPAKVPITDPRYGGAILINPGGPGGSGISKALRQGPKMQSIVDAALEPEQSTKGKFFDIIGFDPRGINHTAPRLECFPGSSSRLAWTLQSDADGLLGNHQSSLDMRWARYEARSKACMRRIAEQGDQSIAHHVGTNSVARDMIEIVEKHGQWRQAKAEAWLKQTTYRPYDRDVVRNRTRWRRNAETVQYWGISYGTFLGVSLAATYPERIERIMLDSVVLPEAYHDGSWTANLQDTDKILTAFCALCYSAGPDNCAFYRGSVPAVMEAVEKAHERLQNDPIAVSATDYRGPEIITYSDLKRLIGRAVYHPIEDFPRVARFLQAISEGNGSEYADWKAAQRGLTLTDFDVFAVSEACKKQGPYSPACQNVGEWQDETQAAIYCSDGTGMDGMDKDAFSEYWSLLRNQSTLLGDIWAEYRLMCVGWDVQSKSRFEGSFSAITSKPMLLLNNQVDPVTPVRNAFAVSDKFPGSAVLVQNTIGHESLTASSKCTEAVIKAYFQHGTLPYSGKSCEVDELPFGVHKEQFDWPKIMENPAKIQQRVPNSLIDYAEPGGPDIKE